MKIFLLGLPASGKTTIGRELAGALQIAFLDLDREVEKQEGMSIQRIFEERSEEHFRRIEAGILREWCDGKLDFVLSTGGGTPCFFDNLLLMNRTGKTVFLDVPLFVLAQRMSLSSLSVRPLFAHTKPEEIPDQLEKMHRHRLSFYARAHITVSGEDISSSEVLERIRKASV